jgi:hypothetical protein
MPDQREKLTILVNHRGKFFDAAEMLNLASAIINAKDRGAHVQVMLTEKKDGIENTQAPDGPGPGRRD